jgi:methionine-rich copper-binding protein CopC
VTFILVSVGISFRVAAEPRHVLSSRPAADAIIQGRHAEYMVRFDGPVDHQSARLTITQSGKLIQSLTPLLDSAADVLFAGHEAPAPGEYRLHWDVRSSDGETSSGDISFRVQP